MNQNLNGTDRMLTNSLAAALEVMKMDSQCTEKTIFGKISKRNMEFRETKE